MNMINEILHNFVSLILIEYYFFTKINKILVSFINIKIQLKINFMSILKKYQAAKGNYKVTFTYPANEGTQTVQVLGDFNNWNSNEAPKLKKGKEGFTTTLELNAGNSYEFRYLINSNQWENDVHADQHVPSLYAGTNNSLLQLDAVEAPVKKTTAVKAISSKRTTTETKKVEAKVAKAATSKKVDLEGTVKAVKVVASKRSVKKPAK